MKDLCALTEADQQYLKDRHPAYRQCLDPDKEDFCLSCAKHIMAMHNISEDDEYALAGFHRVCSLLFTHSPMNN